MILLWLLLGICVVTAAFFIPGNPPEVWPNLNAAGIAALLYIIALIIYTARKPFSRKAQIIVGCCSAVFLGGLAVHWTGMDETTHWQKQTLLKIREIISRGIVQAEVPDSLMEVLDEFHHQPKAEKATLAQIFRKHFPNAEVGSNIRKLQSEGDSLFVFVSALSDTHIVLIAQETFVKGRAATFKNLNGKTGMVQERFTLTAKGMHYESEN